MSQNDLGAPCCVVSPFFVFSSDSFWTSSSLDVPAGVTQEEGHTGFLIHLLSAVHCCCFVVVFTLKAVPISTQYFLTSVLVQLTRTPSVVTG